jgi:hypothetical protein
MPDPMLYRSTNTIGHTHFQGDLVSGVADGRGVQLGTASTGEDPNIDPVGDAANIGMRVRQKGTGTLRLGSTDAGAPMVLRGGQIDLGSADSTVAVTGAFRISPSSAVITSTHINLESTRINLGSSGAVITLGGTTSASLQIAGSTAPFSGFLRVTVANCTTANFASTDAGKTAETTVTVTGVNSSHFVLANAVTFPTGIHLADAYPVASTAGSVHLVWVQGSTVTVANSTASIRFCAIRF